MKEEAICWYAGVLVTKSASDREDYVPLFEESVVVVTALDEDEARRKIQALAARESQTSYLTADGARVSWELVHVLDVQALRTAPEDGATVYARHFRDYEAYRRFEPLLDGSIDGPA